MPLFKYKALDKSQKIVQGMLDTTNREFATETLREKGLSIISLRELSGSRIMSNLFGRIKLKDIVVFSRQFSVLISANVVMVQSLKILAEQTESLKLRMIISDMAYEVDSGSRLSDALAKRPHVFSNLYVNIVKSGEVSGKLDEVLNYLADEMENDYDMMSKIKGAMIYPIFVVGGLLAVGAMMMIFVVPKLTAILVESGAELPLTTRTLIWISEFFTNFWWLVSIILIGIVLGFRLYIRYPAGRRYFDYIKLKLPVFGKLLQYIYLARFTRSMNTLIVGGITISNSLKIVADVVGNKIYQELLEETIKEVEDGNSISSVFINSKEIPVMISQMLNIGEKTGKLDIILGRITNFYSREISNMVANLMNLMEPLIMVIMGVAVGIMVAAVILPMYNMASSF